LHSVSIGKSLIHHRAFLFVAAI